MKLLQRIKNKLPSQKDIQELKFIALFGSSFKEPELWRFTRTSTAKGIAIGVFCAFLPMPLESLPAIFLAIYLKGNLPLSVAGVWISNPVTWLPLYTPCYLLGAKILNIKPIVLSDMNFLSLGWHYAILWLGCLIVGSVLSLSSYFLVQFLWIHQIKQKWINRHQSKPKK